MRVDYVVLMMTPEQRTQRARIAAHSSWANTPDRSARTANARRGLNQKFQEEARRRLGPRATERDVALAADSARSAHYRQLALRSARARAAARDTCACTEPCACNYGRAS